MCGTGVCSHEEEWRSHPRGGVEYETVVEKRSMQPCRVLEYGTMWRSGVCSPVPEWSIMQPCEGVEYEPSGGVIYAVMYRNGVEGVEYTQITMWTDWDKQSNRCGGVSNYAERKE